MDNQHITKADHGVVPDKSALLSGGMDKLIELRSDFDQMNDVLSQLQGVGEDGLSKKVDNLKRQLKSFSVSISVVGQVKAGKTTLANVLAGRPGLLPSDVNPWTSVVTTLHVNNVVQGKTRACFNFFSQEEWDALVSGGGRLGELANRAGSDEELEEIRSQISVMQSKAKERLGRNFELLLGQEHRYDHYDTALLERYVCLGEEGGTVPDAQKQGRFADLTKSAEIFVDLPHYPMPMSLRDTPGVNDPFLVREQITIQNIRGSEICVVVLSAHQAFTTMDMALVRIIASLSGRQLILFVNRIDELSDPSKQVDEIRTSIACTLKSNGVEANTKVVFGCAKWAEAVLDGQLDALPDDSKAALLNWAHHEERRDFDNSDMHAWHLSGVPGLLEAIAERAAEGSGVKHLEKVRKRALNVTNQCRATKSIGFARSKGNTAFTINAKELQQAVLRNAREQMTQLEEIGAVLLQDFQKRMHKIEDGFVERSTQSLIKHLNGDHEIGDWTCEPGSLRIMARAAYASFGQCYKKEMGAQFTRAAAAVEALYHTVLQDAVEGFKVEPPALVTLSPPVVLARTIALDMQNSWWKRWWASRRGYDAYAGEYRKLILSEVQTITACLYEEQAQELLQDTKQSLVDFLEEQRHTLERIGALQDITAENLSALLSDEDEIETQAQLGGVVKTLEQLAA
ncbi:MAG: dynamin family protein [Halocynthiibacter sp.]